MLDESCENIRKRGIDISYSKDVVDFILSKNQNRSYGAREVRRLITTLFEDEYIDRYYQNEINFGDNLIAAVDSGKIVFTKK